MISMIFAVQFVSLTSQLDLPDAHSSFRDLGSGFAWANFQFKPPFRIGDPECQVRSCEDEAQRGAKRRGCRVLAPRIKRILN